MKVYTVYRSTFDRAPAISGLTAYAQDEVPELSEDEHITPVLSYQAEDDDHADNLWPVVLMALEIQNWEFAHALGRARATRFAQAGDEPIPDAYALEGALFYRTLPDGRQVVVWPMSFGKARLCVGEAGSMYIDNAYCYPDPKLACAAGRVWSGDGDPLDGWTRHPNTGRRREDGDPTKETVRW